MPWEVEITPRAFLLKQMINQMIIVMNIQILYNSFPYIRGIVSGIA